MTEAGERDALQRYVEGYRRIPQGDEDEWGDLAMELDRAADATMRRLDAEDQAVDKPW